MRGPALRGLPVLLLQYAHPVTGLIPENLGAGIDRRTPHNSAADNYPFMVLVSALTDSALFQGTMSRMLETETALTSRIGHMPDAYSFSDRVLSARRRILTALFLEPLST